MIQTTVYFYTGSDGTSTVQTPIQIPGATATKTQVRLSADAGKILTDGTTKTNCIDVDSSDVSKWSEITDDTQKTTGTP